MSVVKITEAYLKQCKAPINGQTLVYDECLTGFGVRLNSKSIVFFAEKRLARTNQKRRITIGQYPLYKVAEARREAEAVLSELAKGIDRKAIERATNIKALKLSDLLLEYLATRQLKDQTAKRYIYCFQQFLTDWNSRPWIEITSAMVKSRHDQISKLSGPGSANYTSRALSAVINYSMGVYRDQNDYPLIPENPVLVLSRTHSWNKLKPRTSYIKESELKQWWDGVEKLNNSDATDFFKVLIMSGLRRAEALSLAWSNIDFIQKSLKVPITKNGDEHILPLPPYLLELFKRRFRDTTSEYVFTGSGRSGHLVEIKRSLNQAIKLTGIKFSCHDLRRSFAMYADNLEISANGIKRLMNHRSNNDVTFTHYLPFNIERLRKPMDRISIYVLKSAGVVDSSPASLNLKETPGQKTA